MRNNYPVLEWYEDSKNIQIAESVIHLNTPNFSLCSAKNVSDTNCLNVPNGANIRLIHYDTNTLQTVQSNTTLSLLDPAKVPLFTITKRGIFTISPLLRIVPKTDDSYKNLIFDITLDSEVLSRLIISTDNSSVSTVVDPYTPIGTNTIKTKILGGSYLTRTDPVGFL